MVSVMRDMRHYREARQGQAAPPRHDPSPAEHPRSGTVPFPWRKTLRSALLACALGAAAWGGWQGWQVVRRPAFMPISTIHVRGLSPRIGLPAVNQALRPYLHQGFLWIDPSQIRQALLQVPWVATADVRRVWPDRLDIQLGGVTPVARWLGGSGEVMDAGGQVYHVPPGGIPAGLPNLVGPANAGAGMMKELGRFNAILAPLGLHVTDLEENPRGGWRCILNNGVRLVPGRTHVISALHRWVRVAPEIGKYLVPGATMDLRYSNGFAVALPTAATSSVIEGSGIPRSKQK